MDWRSWLLMGVGLVAACFVAFGTLKKLFRLGRSGQDASYAAEAMEKRLKQLDEERSKKS